MNKYLCSAALCIAFASHSLGEWLYAGGENLPSNYPYAHKIGKDDTGRNDSNMCWAATSSNLIEFWQQRYQKQTGLPLPSGVPGGTDSSKRGSVVFDTFVKAWPNTGLGVEEGLHWYFSGYYHQAETIAPSLPGGYWAEYCTTLGYQADYDSLHKKDYVDFTLISYPTNSDYYSYDKELNIKLFSNAVKAGLEAGSLIALGVTDLATMGHYITLYGADFDKDGIIRSVLIQDNNYSKPPTECDVVYNTATATVGSDDGKEGSLPLKEIEYTKITLPDLLSGYGDRQLTSIEYLNLQIIPEPGTAVLSLLSLTIAVLRRRR